MTATDLDSAEGRQSPWAPLRFPVFRALFSAQLASHIGTLMQSVGSAWLMGDLGASPFLIALVPTASMLPVLLVGIPGGALADIVDRRRLLIAGQVWMLLCAAALAVMSFLDVVTPFSLLALTFGLGLGGALTFPAFQAIQPELELEDLAIGSRVKLSACMATKGRLQWPIQEVRTQLAASFISPWLPMPTAIKPRASQSVTLA